MGFILNMQRCCFFAFTSSSEWVPSQYTARRQRFSQSKQHACALVQWCPVHAHDTGAYCPSSSPSSSSPVFFDFFLDDYRSELVLRHDAPSPSQSWSEGTTRRRNLTRSFRLRRCVVPSDQLRTMKVFWLECLDLSVLEPWREFAI